MRKGHYPDIHIISYKHCKISFYDIFTKISIKKDMKYTET